MTWLALAAAFALGVWAGARMAVRSLARRAVREFDATRGTLLCKGQFPAPTASLLRASRFEHVVGAAPIFIDQGEPDEKPTLH